MYKVISWALDEVVGPRGLVGREIIKPHVQSGILLPRGADTAKRPEKIPVRSLFG